VAAPATIYPTPLHAVAAIQQGAADPAATCGPFTYYPTQPPPIPRKVKGGTTYDQQPVPELPPELQGRGLIRYRDCPKAPCGGKCGNRFQAQLCGLMAGGPNPWVDCPHGRALMQDAAGTLYLAEHVCLLGFGHTEFRVFTLDGAYVCSQFATNPDPKDPFPPDKYFPKGPDIASAFPEIGVAEFLKGIGGTPDLSGLANILATLVLSSDRIRGAVASLAPGMDQALGGRFVALTSAFNQIAPGLGDRFQQALDDHGNKVLDGAKDGAAFAGAAAVEFIIPGFRNLAATVGADLSKLADVYKDAITRLSEKILTVYREEIEGGPPVTPANVHEKAARALAGAMLAGSVAQLAGMALELLHPLKNMGVQQAIGVLTQFAGFGEIARPFFSATLRHGIGNPAERRAAKHFRTELPPPGLVKVLAAKGLIPLGKYHERLELEGYPEPYPAAFVDDVYADLSPFTLATLMDGSEADRPWVARKLRGAQLSPDDAARFERAVELRATRPGRNQLLTTLVSQYVRGHLREAELDSGFEGAGLTPSHRAYWHRAALLERRGTRMDAIAEAVLAQYVNDRVSQAAVAQLLTGLGFTADEVTVRVLTADLRRQAKLVADEAQELEAEIRSLKSKGLTNALRQVRAGFLPAAVFQVVAEGMGYSGAYVQTVLALELAKGPPTTLPDEPAIGLGAVAETRERLAALLADQVRLQQVDRLQALRTLAGLGLPTDLAAVLVNLADALAGPAARLGDYGFPSGAGVAGGFGEIVRVVVAGLAGLGDQADLVRQVLHTLGIELPAGEASQRLLAGLIDLFRR